MFWCFSCIMSQNWMLGQFIGNPYLIFAKHGATSLHKNIGCVSNYRKRTTKRRSRNVFWPPLDINLFVDRVGFIVFNFICLTCKNFQRHGGKKKQKTENCQDPILCSISREPSATSLLQLISSLACKPPKTKKQTQEKQKSMSRYLLPPGLHVFLVLVGLDGTQEETRYRGEHGELARYGSKCHTVESNKQSPCTQASYLSRVHYCHRKGSIIFLKCSNCHLRAVFFSKGINCFFKKYSISWRDVIFWHLWTISSLENVQYTFQRPVLPQEIQQWFKDLHSWIGNDLHKRQCVSLIV